MNIRGQCVYSEHTRSITGTGHSAVKAVSTTWDVCMNVRAGKGNLVSSELRELSWQGSHTDDVISIGILGLNE